MRKGPLLTALGVGTVALCAGVKEATDFDCQPELSGELAAPLEELRTCLKRYGHASPVDEEHYSLGFEVGGVYYKVDRGLNIFEEEGLTTDFPGHHYFDSCFDGSLEPKGYGVRDDYLVGTTPEEHFLAEQDNYAELISKFADLCKYHATEEAPSTAYECLSEAMRSKYATLPNYKPSVVEIYNPSLDGACSGFLTDFRGHPAALTAAHCVVSDNKCLKETGGESCKEAEYVTVAWPITSPDGQITSFNYALGLPISSMSFTGEHAFTPNEDWAYVILPQSSLDMSLPTLQLASKPEEALGDGEFLLIGHGGLVTYSSVLFERIEREQDSTLIKASGTDSCRGLEGFSGGPLINLSNGEVLGTLSLGTIDMKVNSSSFVPVSAPYTASQNTVAQGLLDERLQHFSGFTSPYQQVHSTHSVERIPATLTDQGLKMSTFPTLDFK